ncbi:MAG: zinc ribbon domain-containing protein [Chloroflexi bacterium]|nr:MAG: zinc ribbon domain-containing protein [Chloroflexota bacterium]
MPIYEYRCNACGRTFAFLYGVARDSRDPACPGCQGRDLARLRSRIARVRSEEAMLEDLADPTKIGDVEDPRSLAKWAKKMGSALGDEAGEDFGAVVDEMMDAEHQGHGGGEPSGEGVDEPL